jgi:hypothetical protein
MDMIVDASPKTTTITPDSCRRGRRPRAGGLSSFWTARHYTILCFRHNLSPQIGMQRREAVAYAFSKTRLTSSRRDSTLLLRTSA